MALKYRVSIQGLKGFARIYELKPSTTLYEFHKRMRDDMDFSRDQLIQFKGLDADGALVARFAAFDLGSGTMDGVSLADAERLGIASFVYFYDVTNKKSLVITCEGEVPDVPGKQYPDLVEVKGPNPIEFEHGYVAYEDLPEDQKHHPGEPGWASRGKMDDENLEDFEEDDEDLDSEEDDIDEEAEEVFDEEAGEL